MRFLLRWQHVHPGSQLHGAQGVLEIVTQLQGFQLAAGAWEAEVLPARVARYEPGLLDQLCLSGEIAWGRFGVEADGDDGAADGEAGPRARTLPTRATPLALARREDLVWLLEATAPQGTPRQPSQAAAVALALLEQRGALFLHEIRAALGGHASDAPAEDALRELVYLGLVTCDGFAAVRQVVSPARHAPARIQPGMGRWSLLRGGPPAFAADERAPFADQPAWVEKLARQYLRRYGVIVRDLLAREPRCPPWRELLRVYRRLEDRGEVRGGRFAQAFSGEQFALPEALDALRSVRRTEPRGTERVLLSACDPLNVAGILTPGPRVPAHAGNRVLWIDGALAPLDPDRRSLA